MKAVLFTLSLGRGVDNMTFVNGLRRPGKEYNEQCILHRHIKTENNQIFKCRNLNAARQNSLNLHFWRVVHCINVQYSCLLISCRNPGWSRYHPLTKQILVQSVETSRPRIFRYLRDIRDLFREGKCTFGRMNSSYFQILLIVMKYSFHIKR